MTVVLLVVLAVVGLASLALVAGLLRVAGEGSRAEEADELREHEQSLKQRRRIAAHVESTTRGAR